MKEFDEKNLPDQPETTDEETVVSPETEDAAVTADVAAEEEPAADKKAKTPNRRLRYGGMAALVTTLVIVGVVVLNIFANVLFDRFPLSFDMTSDDRFTISQETVDMIQSVKKPVEIIAFFKEDYLRNPSASTTEMNTVFKQLHETWKQYELQSKNRVTVKYVDIAIQPTLVKEYEKYGTIQEGSILFRSGTGTDERYRLKTIGDFYTYETDSYGYTLTNFTSQVEMMTASGVKAVTSNEDLQVMLLTGHEEESDTVSTLTNLYELNGYSVSQINLASAQVIGDKVTTAIIAAPAKDFTDAEITRLRDWLTNDGKLGRNLMVVVNSLATSKDCPNLYEFLNDGYQIEVTDNMVVETEASRAYAGYSAQVIYGDLPESPVQAAAKEAGVLCAMPRQILLKAGTDNSKNLFNIPLVAFPDSSRLVSMMDGENAAQKKAESYPVYGMGMTVQWTYDNSGENSAQVQTNVVVCGQDMVNSTVFGMQTFQNQKVMLDVMNYINGNEDSVTVPGRDITQTTTEFSAGTANMLGLVFALFLPLGLLVICLVIFLRRRHL